jgi:hypothetical protein
LRRLIPIILSVLLAAFCSPRTEKKLVNEGQFDTLATPSDSLTFYFPFKSSWQDTTNNALDTFVNTWYSKMLFGLKEPVLKAYSGDKEVYRFTWLRTFHHPVSLRLEKQNNIIRLMVKVANGAGGYEPGQVIADTTINVTKEEWQTFTGKVETGKFWELQTETRDDDGKDGSEWILEAVKENKYHIVTRWTPTNEKYGSFRAIGEYLIALAKLQGDTNFNY